MSEAIGRVYFPGNPWPDGHPLETFEWSARFVPGSGIWFDFHLETIEFRSIDPPEGYEEPPEEDYENERYDWECTDLWHNYSRSIISSSFYARDIKDANGKPGFLAATPANPLDFSEPLDLTADPAPEDPNDWPRAFGAYILGHDAVADHRFELTPLKGPGDRGHCSVGWTGKIALVYGGSTLGFAFEFRAEVPRAPFGGIRLPDGEPETLEACRACLSDPEGFETVEVDGEVWMKPKQN